jgi:lactoylglutathione lyase
MRIAHLAIKVDDLEAAGEFYEKVFGFRDVRQGQNRDHYSRHMTDGQIDIALLKYDAGSQSKEATALGNKTGIHHFGFEVDSVEDFAEELKKRGLEVISNPGVIPLKFKVPGGGVAEVAPRKHFKIN